MFGSPSRGASAYAAVSLESGIIGASPNGLVVMLYDGAIASVTQALNNMQEANPQEKGRYISKAIQIIDSGLRASLNKKAGGGLATNLDSLYEYMSNRLLIANLRNKAEILIEVRDLLVDLKSAWVEIGNRAEGVKAAPSSGVTQASAAERHGNMYGAAVSYA